MGGVQGIEYRMDPFRFYEDLKMEMIVHRAIAGTGYCIELNRTDIVK